MNRRVLILGVASLALLLAAFLTRGFGLLDQPEQELKLYGNVDVRQVDLAFRVPGRIAAIAFEEGSRVPAGVVLARLDRRTFDDAIADASAQVAQADAELARQRNGNRRQDIDRARAAVAEQQAQVDKARQDLARRESLLPSGAVSQAVVTATRGDYRAAVARLESAQQALSLQQAGSRSEDIRAAEATRAGALAKRERAVTDLADTEIKAPSAGTVLTRAQEPGAIVQAGQTVVTLTIDRPMRVRAYVAESDLSRIAPGMAVMVSADGNTKTYHGTIAYVAPTAEFTPKSVQTESLRADLVYRVRILVNDPDGGLRQGQPVTVAVSNARPAKR
ncbi:HlyD family efflux transporter periplasmic adaptor subunit [Sphingomonas sp. KRR8]|uniref:HlyD family efflux transporter periplasmic adaptor subunit n=1 Tax=Sphingomonas sp. KRR8 TaxID=2942996 RepID=UPI00201FBA43|nr:HlyD family efflux transporter periplasmic adaptor subunit [Sphingomonas sp. KRR8]URD60716.1 HlyD family efflux transporter periplasmic adaptor subunit [Sphingomonas sp. KRR8]